MARLADGHKTVYISGLGDTPATVEVHANFLNSYLYRVPVTGPDNVDVVHNTSSLLGNDPAEISAIRKYVIDLLKMMDRFSEGDIGLVFIAHSLGVRVLLQALDRNRLAELRCPVDQLMGHIAIFTLGGVGVVPRRAALVVKNYRFDSDIKSKCATAFCAGSRMGGCVSCEERSMISHGNIDIIPGGQSQHLHSMEDYLDSKMVLDDITRSLGVDAICNQPRSSSRP